MGFNRTVFVFSGAWILVITLLHCWLNLGVFKTSPPKGSFKVGFLPVT